MSEWNPMLLNVFLVEDDPAVRGMLKRMLKGLKVGQILETADGHEAMRQIGKPPRTIDLIVCDWNLPSMSGADLLREVRATGNRVPFVMVTARSDEQSIKEAKALDVSAYLPKPFTLTQLEAKLRAALAKSR